MPLIVGAQSAVAPLGYSIDNSCMFDKESDDYLSRTFGSGGDLLKWTYSCWVKRNNTLLSNHQLIGGGYFTDIKFRVNDMHFGEYDGGYVGEIITDRIFRDTSAWYHFVFVWDSHNAAAGNRMRIYCNGVEETSFSGDVEPPLDQASKMNTAAAHTIASNRNEGGTADCDVYLADCIFIDGEAYAASDFGEFSEDSPSIWVPKDPSDLTMTGTSFWLDFANSADLGNDVSGNSNDWTSNNIDATNQCTDSPTNNFCVMNVLDNYYPAMTFAEGSLQTTTTGSKAYVTGTMALSAGLWYWEVKVSAEAAGAYSFIGIADVPATGTTTNFALGYTATTWCYYGFDGKYRNSDTSTTYGDSYAATNVIGVYLDLSANKLYFAKDGVIQNSGTGISITAPASLANGQYFPATNYWDAGVATYAHNFGNPIYALTSAVADSNGYGQFEYSPNDGGSASFDGSAKNFLAICSKNLGSDGG